MRKTEILEWIQNDFQPINLVTPPDVIMQQIDNAIRYWNTHSAYKIIRMYPFSGSKGVVEISNEFKDVVRVNPGNVAEHIWRDNPTWMLTGIYLLENYTMDMIAMTEAFKSYKVYMGLNLQFVFKRGESPDENGRLIINGMPPDNDAIAVTGTKRLIISNNDIDIKDENILDWILYYSKALVKMVEGNTLRKSDIVGIKNDGQALFDEGKEEQKDLQERLSREGRWLAFVSRF